MKVATEPQRTQRRAMGFLEKRKNAESGVLVSCG